MALGAFLFLPFVRPFCFSLFAWTYLVPVLPFVMWFDGTVSCSRSHSLSELRELVDEPGMRSYEWWCETLRAQTCMLPVTVLIGCPKRSVNESGQSFSRLRSRHSQEQLLVLRRILPARLGQGLHKVRGNLSSAEHSSAVAFAPVLSKKGFLERCQKITLV